MSMLGISFLDVQGIRRIALLGLLGSLVLMVLLSVGFGMEIKGARRWLSLGFMTIQPSEFARAFFVVVSAWILAERFRSPNFPAFKAATALWGVMVLLLLAQPDFGMTFITTLVWGAQMFLAGLPWWGIIAMTILGIIVCAIAYATLPHVAHRIEMFLHPDSTERYQVNKSLEALQNGSILGRGIGEGTAKQSLPDSHTDYIFSVIVEEFGLLVSVGIIALFAFVVVRGLMRLWNEENMFVILAASGLIFQFGLQAAGNIGVAMDMLPPKGMTLPFISYGGSSTLALALGMGMFLALTRRRFGLMKWSQRRARTLKGGASA